MDSTSPHVFFAGFSNHCLNLQLSILGRVILFHRLSDQKTSHETPKMSKTSHLVIPKSLVREPLTPDPFIPGSANLFPKLRDRLNASAWELWYVDGVASDGQTGLAIGMTRDARGASKGGFRVEVHTIWRNGDCDGAATQPSVAGMELYFPESLFTEDAEGKITAVWQSPRRVSTEDPDQGSREEQLDTVSLTADEDLSTVTLHFQIPAKVTGSVVLRSNLSHRADIQRVSRPTHEGSAMLGPKVYYLRPQPISCVEAHLSIQIPPGSMTGSDQHDQSPPAMGEFHLTTADQAIGGMDRFWAPLQWPSLMSESYHLRAGAGPYRLHLLRLLTTKETGQEPQVSARLYRDGRVVCEAQLEHPAGAVYSTGEDEGFDYVVFHKKYAASEQDQSAVRGKYRENCTGCCVEFVHPRGERGRESWKFEVDYVREWWNIPLSAPGPEATGNSSFLVTVSGGLVNVINGQDREHFEGNGGCGQAALP